jgi:uncharacterized protein YukE
MTGYDADTAALNTHVSTLKSLADELSTALSAARQVNLTSTSYGESGQSFVSAMQGMASTGQETLRTAVTELESAATALSRTAAAYDNQESAHSAEFGDIGGKLA